LKDDIEYYNRIFNETDKFKEFPTNKYSLTGTDAEFTWSQFLDEDFYFQKFDDLTESDIKFLSRKSHRIEQVTFDGGKIIDTCFRIKKGDVWVGSMSE